jgi:hypothetical protein
VVGLVWFVLVWFSLVGWLVGWLVDWFQDKQTSTNAQQLGFMIDFI